LEVEYSMGDRVWLPYHEVSCLEAIGQYLEALGIPGIRHLPKQTPIKSSSIPTATVNDLHDS
ncbi:hypothetical protein CY34DRAFT_96672, partial [Suillus luteus UH-Slu-Lm8-n1]